MAAASKTRATLFAVFKNLNAFSPFSLYVFFSSLSTALYRHSRFHLCIFYHSLSECLIHGSLRFFCFSQNYLSHARKVLSILSDPCVAIIYLYSRRYIFIHETKVRDVYANSSYLDAKRQTTLGMGSGTVRHLECSSRDRRYSRSRNEMSRGIHQA